MAGQRKKIKPMQRKIQNERRHKAVRPVGIHGDYWAHRCISGTWSSLSLHREECGGCPMTLVKVQEFEGRRDATA
jgi:hypothetical protein